MKNLMDHHLQLDTVDETRRHGLGSSSSMTSGSQRHDQVGFSIRRWPRRSSGTFKLAVFGAIVILLAALIVAVTVSSTHAKKKKQAAAASSESPTTLGDDDGVIGETPKTATTRNGPIRPNLQVSAAVLANNQKALINTLKSTYDRLNLDTASLLTQTNSSQYKALTFVSGSASFNSSNVATNIQRYALAVFYYSTFLQPHSFWTNPTDWTSATNWISDAAECTWEGITCNSDQKVTIISLPDHALSGHLPEELGLLESLDTLDLSNNYIFQGGSNLQVFSHLRSVQSLALDNNYILTTTGLPSQLAFMQKLRQVQMSYNLLQGPLDNSLFQYLTQLSHLEVESNYLAGTLPSSLGRLSNLVYLYLRRNLLQIDLSQVLTAGQYPALFSVWLDSNNVTGTLPTTMGLLTDLASFSVTNTSLRGPLPTEMGRCTSLQRLWLYQNQLTGSIPETWGALSDLEVAELYENDLTGTMPSGLCQAVVASTYQYKSLIVDCQQVSCSCCTDCM